MAQYRIGTATFTNGSATVTGSGTEWLSNLSAGDYIVRQGDANNTFQAYQIGGITNDTTLTLTAPYGGDTASGVEYVAHIDFLPNGAPEFDNGDIETASILNAHLAKLESIANLGTAAYLDAQTSLTDTTADRLMKVGAGGWLGQVPPLLSGVDYDDLRDIGSHFFIANNQTNAPNTQKSFFLHVIAGTTGTDRCMQIAYDYSDTNQVYVRGFGGLVWSNWSLQYNRDTILGTVSQSGGVPTGAIIERGSNANGEYVKFADGTMICTQESTTQLPTPTANGALYISGAHTATFPSSFISPPNVARYAHRQGTAGALGIAFTCAASDGDVTTTTVRMVAVSTLSTNVIKPAYLAIGRWY